MDTIKLIFLFAATLMLVQCSPASSDEKKDISTSTTSQDAITEVEDQMNNDEEDLSDFVEDEDEDEIEEDVEDPAYYRRKCRYVRKCRSSKKCSRVRIPAKYSAGKGQYKKPSYQLRCKPVRRCRRVRVCRKVRVQRKYGKY